MSGQSQQKSPETFFRTAKVGHHKIEDATPALRIFGDGERSLIFSPEMPESSGSVVCDPITATFPTKKNRSSFSLKFAKPNRSS
ncbi:MAG: hypothetical protein AAF387_11480, partial [Pseudomonadota bacterium]